MADEVVIAVPSTGAITDAVQTAVENALEDDANEETEVREWLRLELAPLRQEMTEQRQMLSGLHQMTQALSELNLPAQIANREETILRLLSRLEESLTPKVLEILPLVPATPPAVPENVGVAHPAAETIPAVAIRTKHRGI